MHAYVAGNLDEIRKLANDLANACDTVEYCIVGDGEGTDCEIEYDNRGRINIRYFGTGKRNDGSEEVEKEIERIREEVKEDKKSILDKVDEFDWDEE